LAIWGRLYFYMNFNTDFSIYVKNDIGIFWTQGFAIARQVLYGLSHSSSDIGILMRIVFNL
jgi:hypothetical protein